MTFTKEQLQHIIETDHVQCGDASALARMALAGMEAEPAGWFVRKKFMHSHPTFKNSPNAFPLYSAPQPLTTSERAELENYRSAQQVVPSYGRDQFEEWFKFHHGDEHSIVMLQRANGGANYIDPYVDLAWISWKDSRAAMLQGKAEPVTTAYNLPDDFDFDRFNDVAWLEAVASNPHMHSLTTSTIAKVALELNRKLDAGNSPVIPDGWVMVPKEITCAMDDAAWEAYHETRCMSDIWAALLAAAAPQQED